MIAATYISVILEHAHKYAYKKAELIRSLVTDIIRVVEESAGILTTRLWSPPLTGCVGLGAYSGLVEVVAETVYRAKPGSSVFLLPLESGPSIHPVFLVPFVPGSSVKGVVRAAFVETSVLRGLDRGEAERCANAVFGDSETIGVSSMVFMDAYPVGWGENGLLWGDVVTPHYHRANAEWEARPVPAVGISIAPGVRFRFTVLVDEWLLRQRLCKAGCCGHVPGEGLELAAYLLVYALEHVGLGGKTSRGYGFFRVQGLRLHRCGLRGTRGRVAAAREGRR